MTPTAADLMFWQSKNLPGWVKRMKKPPAISGGIHACIASRSQKRRPDYESDAGTLVAILKSIRKREDVLPALERIAQNPGCLIRPERRAAYARKWAARIRLTRGGTVVRLG